MQSISVLKPFLDGKMQAIAYEVYGQIDTDKYFDDVLYEICDENIACSDSGDWRNYLRDNAEKVAFVIGEFGWDGVGQSLERAALCSMFEDLLNRCYENISFILNDCAFNYILDNYNLSYLPDEALDALTDLCEDSNTRMDDFRDSMKEILTNFAGKTDVPAEAGIDLDVLLAAGA